LVENLAKFLAPLDPQAVRTKAKRREMALEIGKCEQWDPALFTWERLIEIAPDIHGEDELRVTSNRHNIPLHFFDTGGNFDCKKLNKLLDRGASILVQSAHRYDEKLAAIVRDFLALADKPARLGAIGSTGSAGALPRHSDPFDLFIVQMEGAKRWRFYAAEDAKEPIADHILSPGDFAFVPSGTIHECDSVEGCSLHLGLGFAGPNYDVWGEQS
jgi:ribosomal protein L16 Arg81 hydroxylase